MTFTLNLTFERCTHCHELNSQTQQTTHTRLGGGRTRHSMRRRRRRWRWARRRQRRGHGVTLRCVKHLQNIQFIPHSTFKHLLKSTHNIVYTYTACVANVYTVCPVYDVKCLCSGGWEWGREATPTSISIFDSYDIKTLGFEFGNDIFTGNKMPTL